ncbi:fatty acid cis/trans isomerase [Allohahella marinimesophila]|uniref:Fatty acid cis/trans isomerase n=1 Tax=Allohahella marinimesophila TaxID=1054972 RepID=A0ABP7NIB3_9GAMM
MFKRITLAVILSLIFGCSVWQARQFDEQYGPADAETFDAAAAQFVTTEPQLASASTADDASRPEVWQAAERVLETRCVVCHGCLDSPCQLNMSRWDGIARGAVKTPVYDGTRLSPARITNLIDAPRLTSEWRQEGFFPVLNERTADSDANIRLSVLAQMLLLKQRHPGGEGKLLPPEIRLGLNAAHECPTIEEFDDYASEYPKSGMPYGLPALTPAEHETVLQWVKNGAPHPQRPAVDQATAAQRDRWEAFFNQDSLKGQLSSRYMYEHLFLASLYFGEREEQAGTMSKAPNRFFKLIRSATPPGQPVERLPSRRPYDDPGVDRVYYRLVPEDSTVLVKTHMPYALNDQRMQHWHNLFFEVDYEVSKLPGYDPETASNPFVTFAALPQLARYRFMLEEAHYTISGYIKGPVCRGQVALNVINDYFWVAFADPRFSALAEDADFIADARDHLRLPAEDESDAGLLAWGKFADMEQAYLKKKVAVIDRVTRKEPINLDYLWKGDGFNQNATLTIFRHEDSATVIKGLAGTAPQTAWVITYPLLERIHYLLVAGFDVYGNVGHQLSTRLYMDFLRMEGEFNFLAFLPSQARIAARDHWYRGASEDVKAYVHGRYATLSEDTGMSFETDDPLHEFYGDLKRFFLPLQPEHLELTNPEPGSIEATLTQLNDVYGGAVRFMPQVSFIRVVSKDVQEAEWFSLLHHNAHLNIAHPFNEEERRVPEEDQLMILPGFVGAYPNALFSVESSDVEDFVTRLGAIDSKDHYEAFVDRYGIRRTDKGFWPFSDALHQSLAHRRPLEAGLFDFNRLQNR